MPNKLESLLSAYLTNPTDDNKAALWEAIYSYFLRRDDDHDLAIEATIKAMAALERHNPEKQFTSWLFRIHANLATDNLRKNREVPTEDDELEQIHLANASHSIKLDISPVTDPQTRMLAEDILAGYSLPDAAERCGLTPNAAQKRLKALGKKIPKYRLIL